MRRKYVQIQRLASANEVRETPNNPYFVESQNSVPLKSDFKPAVKVLSRKPAPTVVARKDPISGLEQLTMEDDEDDDDDGFEQLSMTLEERRIKAQKEREEKQKKYEEVREKLFGSSEKVTSTSVADATAVPVVKFSGERNRPKSRGGRDTRPSTTNNIARQLYDPNYSPKPDSNYAQSKEGQTLGLDDEKVIRNPRGPDGSGRGGFGVSNRGGKTL